MKLEHIRLFLSVAENGSISEAAKAGYITQQGLSLALKQLEGELGIELFNRSNKGVSLTPMGQKFYQCCKEMIRLYDDFLFDLHDDERNDVFNLYIASNTYRMLSALNEAPFAQKGGWYFSYVERPTGDAIAMLNENRGIGIFSIHGGSETGLLEKINKDLRVYQVGQEDKVVFVMHKKNLPAFDSAKELDSMEDLDQLLRDMKCIISSSEHDLHLHTEPIRRTICSPDLYSHKQMLTMENTFSIINYTMYRMHFDPTEYVIIREKQLKKPIQYYAVFNLRLTAHNMRLEQEMVKYLKEVLTCDC